MSRDTDSGYRLEHTAIRRAFDKASQDYDASAVLQTEVRGKLLERLEVANLRPQVALDAGCGTGHGARDLLRRYRGCHVMALDLSEGMLAQARRQRYWLKSPAPICADAACLPLRKHSVDLLFSNLMLQWCNDLDAVFREFHRVLRPGGLLSFSTFGPDTLAELRSAWTSVDGYVHVSRFLDMHDIGDALVRAGFAEPVLDVDHFCLTYATLRDLMGDLKAIGASNAAAGRNRGLTGRGRFRSLESAYETHRRDHRLPATYEVVYGQAWGTGTSHRISNTVEASVPVTEIGRRDREHD